jgi:hypothetical protein
MKVIRIQRQKVDRDIHSSLLVNTWMLGKAYHKLRKKLYSETPNCEHPSNMINLLY